MASQGSRPLILVTVHRHENHGKPLEDICRALKEIAQGDVRIFFIVHPNPSIQRPVHELLAGVPNLDLLPPLDYGTFTRLLAQVDLILTDSGGIQEEAPALGKPLLILRDKTERYTSARIESNQLVGTKPEVIIREAERWLADGARRAREVEPSFLYGDGQAGKRIADFFLGNSPEPFSAD
jgi:UDP-N-acetylglucosamine 2-epimerase (non-hydrolysing)